MKYLLGTNACIEFLRHRESPLKKKFAQTASSDILLCSIVKAELLHGAFKSSQPERNLEIMREFVSTFESLPFDDAAAETYGRLRTDLEKAGKLIGPNDLLIASIALANNAILVTHNTDEFSRVSGLVIEDWQE